jgi:hypothetical protein
VLCSTHRVSLALFLIFEPTHVIEPTIDPTVKRLISIYLDFARRFIWLGNAR